MLPISIDLILSGQEVESSRIEYKKNWNPAECIRTICAFANDMENQDGGYIIIGVEERKGRPVLPVTGIDPDEIDDIEKDLLNKCHFIDPFYFPRIEVCEYQGRKLLVLWVTAGEERPYRASKDVFREQSNKAYYIRHGSQTIQADGNMLKELYENSARKPFDDRENPFATIEDLSISLMRKYLHSVQSALYEMSADMDPAVVAENMKLLSGPRECRHPRNVALLMFSDRVNDFFPYARTEVVIMVDPSGYNMTEMVFTGPIQYQLSDALLFISNNVIREMVIKDDSQIETIRAFNYPMPAIKEILANAIYHRSYQIDEPVTVVCMPNWIEIRSFPGLNRSITREMIDRCEIRSMGEYRNRRIGNFLKELHLTEGRNTGIPRVISALEANGSGKPVFITDDERQSLTVRIPIHERFRSDMHRVNPGNRKNRDELRRTVLSVLAGGPRSRREIVSEMGYASLSKTLSEEMDLMIKEGLVKATGKGRASRLALNRK
ncbi:MAG: RNA-binding domain-containing protein [Bullifex sp.]